YLRSRNKNSLSKEGIRSFGGNYSYKKAQKLKSYFVNLVPFCGYSPVLGKEPTYQVGFSEGRNPDIMSDGAILGVLRASAGPANRRDHFSRFDDRNDFVKLPVNSLVRQLHVGSRPRGSAGAANGNRPREGMRPL